MATPEAYYDRHSREYVEKWSRLDVDLGNPSNYFRRLLMDAALRMSALNKIDNIVEIGCGSGLLLKEILGHADRVFGVDISREMLNRAVDSTLRGRRVLIRGDASGVDKVADCREVVLAVDDFLALRLPRAYFDKILSLEVLRYIDDLETCFGNVLAIMKESSSFVFSITNLWSFNFFPLKYRFRARLGLVRKEELVQYFTTERVLKGQLRRAGFEVVGFERLGFLAVNPLVRKFVRAPSQVKKVCDFDRILTKLPILRLFADTFVVAARKLPNKSHTDSVSARLRFRDSSHAYDSWLRP